MAELLLLLAVVLLTASQVLQKVGAQRKLRAASDVRTWLHGLMSREIVLAAVLIGAAAVIWLAVLYRMDVSRAFPLLSLSFVMVAFWSRFALREHVPPVRWLGVIVIVIGVALVSST